MGELSVFVDESGSQGGHSRYCLVTLLFHAQDDSVAEHISVYERDLREKGLPDLPFHASSLMNGHEDYRFLDISQRKRLLSAFEGFVRRLPCSYHVFVYRRSEVDDPELFIARFKRDLVVFLTDNLLYFQSFDKVKIYYDDGQQMVSSALHGAIDFALSKGAVLYRMANTREYRLFQAADCLCALELADLKYREGRLTRTDAKIFGEDYQAFKKNHLNRVRRKIL